ncbi:hypothetical protein NEUTE1DRAFT_149117 [Neurospora tetrasperma FGSC 2508]|uniref:BRCT domain-containing protein n=1 Tax=Neurospora tetrasperma (strain FGSC 2508 / ATCC MYA-4615 / P0657) TaxID=510951 RepID=F8MXV0_NEUT8|nr:uncharacterized protein NEUTE1DRAFT_149117 [Neurospora tetrasperma FGSC 2508]EGO53873.1 hypothetical protein NEUTE1DRAFT_149117 [Neurospora tetrasperma FGSC 2508]EGZ75358.1 hypothetical protein NEUTE2DRAFT_155826 [Neurospora tetrasperma FGSC 2509]
MAPPIHPEQPPPAEPIHAGRAFDPWNSVAAGHQRAETRVPTGWRESRARKLQSQFRASSSGGDRISDSVGAGAEDFDEKRGVLIPKEVRARALNSVADMLRNPGTMATMSQTTSQSRARLQEQGASQNGSQPVEEEETRESGPTQHGQRKEEEGGGGSSNIRKIFDGLNIYVNGSTHPLISDHKLKQILAENGARMSIHLGRRQVTHVILGKPTGRNTGAGGGLAGGKLEKEIRRVGGCGIKYVGVEWVLESIKAGKRLPEARFANLKIAAKRQQSVLSAFSTNKPPA